MIRKLLLLFILFPALLGAGEEALPDSQLVLLKNDSPLIAFRILFRVGSADDPEGKEGLAALTASMLDQAGTKNNDYQKILQLLYPMAASYTAQVDKEMTVLYGVTHKDKVDAYYDLLRDAVLIPAFKQDDFDRLKADQLNYVSKTLRFNDDEELGKETLNRALFQGHPYGHPEDGLVKSVQNLTLQDVKDFYMKYYTRKNLMLGIAGDYSESLLARIRKDFGALPAGAASGNTGLPQPELEGWHVVLVDKDTIATGISFGFPISVTRADEDHFPLLVANAWLGQHRTQTGRLFNVMREARGLNYGDYSYIEHFPMGGRTRQPRPNVARHRQIFQIWIRPVLNQNRHFALRQAARELQNMIESGIPRDEFDGAKNFMLNYTVNLAQSNLEQLGYALDDRFYGLKKPYLDLVRERVGALSREDVNRAIRKHLGMKNMMVAVVGKDAEGFKKALAENTPSPIHYDAPKPESILEEDRLIQAFPLPIPAENITIIPVDKIFE